MLHFEVGELDKQLEVLKRRRKIEWRKVVDSFKMTSD